MHSSDKFCGNLTLPVTHPAVEVSNFSYNSIYIIIVSQINSETSVACIVIFFEFECEAQKLFPSSIFS